MKGQREFNMRISNQKILTAKYPLGMELRPANATSVRALHKAGLITHAQISIPASWNQDRLESLAPGLDLCVHSTFLNVLGKNDWPSLKLAAKGIRRLRPICVVDHLGTFVDSKGKKHGVLFDTTESSTSLTRRAVSNLRRWTELIGVPVYLENMPVTSEVDRYFSLYSEVSEKAHVERAVDIPHLLISCHVNGNSMRECAKKLRLLDPKQVHFGGLSVSSDRIEDNHRQISPELLCLLEWAEINPKLITLEQSDQLPNQYVESMIREIQRDQFVRDLPDFSIQRKTRSSETFSQSLAKDRARSFGVLRPERRHPRKFRSRMLRLTERHYPFIYPASSITSAASLLDSGDALELLAHFLSTSKNFYSWFVKNDRFLFFIEVSINETSLFLDFENEKFILKLPSRARLEFELETNDGVINVFTYRSERRDQSCRSRN